MSWLIPDWQKTVVLIGKEIKQQDKFTHVPIGTGALLEASGVICLITCKHVVVDENGKFRDDIFVVYNTKTGHVTKRKIEEVKNIFKVDWFFHKNKDVDIAVMPFGYDQAIDDIKVIGESVFLSINSLDAADEICVLGFQPDLVLTKIKPVVRSRIISRIEDDKTFYIDASVFPGNSGSPVLLKPSPVMLKERQIHFGGTHLGRFIGICGGYIPYRESAISVQTGRERIIFEENTGLSKVWSIDYIREIIDSTEFLEIINRLKPNDNQQETLPNA